LTHFTFLKHEWPAVFEAAEKAEVAVHPDPRTACFYARRSLEMAVAWLYKHDPSLKIAGGKFDHPHGTGANAAHSGCADG
jgi:type I restriction enzyme R subunit